MTTQISYRVNRETVSQIRDLQEAFNVRSGAAVFRRLLALGNVVSAHIGSDGTITILDRDGKPLKILVRE